MDWTSITDKEHWRRCKCGETAKGFYCPGRNLCSEHLWMCPKCWREFIPLAGLMDLVQAE